MSQIKRLLIKRKLSYRRKTIQNTISISFTIILVIGMILIMLPLYLKIVHNIEDMVEQKNIQTIDQTNQYLDSFLRNMMKVSDAVYYQVIKNTDFSVGSVKEKLDLLYNANREQIVSIAVFNTFGQVEEAVPLSNLKPGTDPRMNDWFLEPKEKIENVYFSTPHVQNLFEDTDYRYRWVVSLSRNIEITKNGKTENGILLVDMNFSGIEQACRSAGLGKSGYVYLVDCNGELIYHPRQQLLYSDLEQENTNQIIHYEDGSFMENFMGKRRMVTVKTVGYTGWKLAAVTPVSDLVSQYAKIQTFMLFIVLFGIFGLIIVSFLVSGRIAKPIKQLERAVWKLEKGDMDVNLMVEGSYEINHLSKTIHSMVEQMKHLMQDIVKEQEQKRKSELDALQTQINPHFLYNTLDSVIWMIENERYQGAITMVTALARFFRISISKGKSIVSVADELEHAANYLTIQRIRFQNKFSYEILAEEDTNTLATVKLIIQPIIENAIYHGMEYMEEDDGGKIIIRSYIENSDLYIEVEDNGIGMSPDILKNILSGQYKKRTKGSGVGMKNVDQRIRLYFGDTYGVLITSEPDAGTLIKIHMPAISLEEIQRREENQI